MPRPSSAASSTPVAASCRSVEFRCVQCACENKQYRHWLTGFTFMHRKANRAALAELKAFQDKVRLEDDIASEAIKEAARMHLEDVLDRGIECIKRRTRVRDYSDAVKVRRVGHCQHGAVGA